jgi:glycosyltransferase involved in cell wall biosynthesis
MDLVKHCENGWIVNVEDADGLARWVKYVYENRGAELDKVLANGRATAEANSYDAQLSRWRDFMKGFVEWKD